MMNVKESHQWGTFKRLCMVPLAAVLVSLNPMEATAGLAGSVSDLVCVDDDVLTVVDHMPEFPGGIDGIMEYLSTHARYPEEAQKAGVQGNVIVSITIRKDGSVTDVKVERSVDPLLDAEAVRVVSEMPKWKPGQNKGKAVDVGGYLLPVNFRLE
ncbi:MAG: energy transducer TonB [Parabacteroides sp.]